VRRPAPGAGAPARPEVRRLPNPRLTGLGGGLFAGAVMLVLGFLDRMLFDGSLTAYAVLFLPVCVLTALWIRPGDLLTAPVVMPIAFTVGLLAAVPGDGGPGGRFMTLVTALATRAGWLYAGTALAAALVAARSAARRRSGTPGRVSGAMRPDGVMRPSGAMRPRGTAKSRPAGGSSGPATTGTEGSHGPRVPGASRRPGRPTTH
jgi:hypothetical protein